MSLPDVNATPGSTVAIPVNLQNDIAVKAFQLDFHNPEGFEVESINKTDRMTDGTSVSFASHDGFYRVVAVNTSTWASANHYFFSRHTSRRTRM